jgi:predicted alpha/beta superfamily hydrolase
MNLTIEDDEKSEVAVESNNCQLNTIDIRVRYPYAGGKMVIYTSKDWERPLDPVEVDQENHLTLFRVETDKTFLYYKPCLVVDGESYYCRGSNYLAIMLADDYEIFPHFFQKSAGSVTDVLLLGEGTAEHKVRVYLPPGYSENTLKRYPVLYMQDGQNLFFPEEAFTGQTWEVEKTLNVLDDMNVMDPVIVVAIYPNDRMHEYTFPGYEDYGKFLVATVKPHIDEHYRTLKDPGFSAVMGSSLGGVVSLYLGWEYPQVFGKVACLSSTFSWKDDLMRRIMDEDKRPIQIYMDSGWPGDNFEVNRAMLDLLQRQRYEVNSEVMYLAFPEASHNEGAWATRIHIPFQFLFARYAQIDMKRLRVGLQPTRDPQNVSI